MPRIDLDKLPPKYLQGMFQTESFLGESGVSIRTLELVRLRASQRNGCAYCIDMHHKEGLHHDDTPQRLYSVGAWRDAPYYDEQERVALAMTEALTPAVDLPPDRAIFDQALEVLGRERFAALTLAIAQINAWNRLVRAFDTPVGDYVAGRHDT